MHSKVIGYYYAATGEDLPTERDARAIKTWYDSGCATMQPNFVGQRNIPNWEDNYNGFY